MKDAQNELARWLTQQNIYFVHELTSKAKPPQPFPMLDIKAFYYLSRVGPRPQKSIFLHNWCWLCVALDMLLDSDTKNYNSDKCIRMTYIVTEYTNVLIQSSNRCLIMSRLLELVATSLLCDNKIIWPSQFEIVSLPQEQQASNKITQ
jgi:hypothetical protein